MLQHTFEQKIGANAVFSKNYLFSRGLRFRVFDHIYIFLNLHILNFEPHFYSIQIWFSPPSLQFIFRLFPFSLSHMMSRPRHYVSSPQHVYRWFVRVHVRIPDERTVNNVVPLRPGFNRVGRSRCHSEICLNYPSVLPTHLLIYVPGERDENVMFARTITPL